MVFPLVVGFIYFSVIVLIGTLHANLILRPLKVKNPSRQESRRGRIRMVDLISLVFLIQLPVAVIAGFSDVRFSDRYDIAALVLFAASLLGIVTWIFGIRAANRIGMTNWFWRAMLVCFSMPVGLFGGLVYAFLALVFMLDRTTFSNSLQFQILLFSLAISIFAYAVNRHIAFVAGSKLDSEPFR